MLYIVDVFVGEVIYFLHACIICQFILDWPKTVYGLLVSAYKFMKKNGSIGDSAQRHRRWTIPSWIVQIYWWRRPPCIELSKERPSTSKGTNGEVSAPRWEVVASDGRRRHSHQRNIRVDNGGIVGEGVRDNEVVAVTLTIDSGKQQVIQLTSLLKHS